MKTAFMSFMTIFSLLVSSPVLAAAVPPYTIDTGSGVGSSTGHFPFVPLTTPGTVGFSSIGIDIEATLSLSPLPIISVFGTNNGHLFSELVSTSATVALTYYFQVLGPEGSVPVNVTASGAAGGTNADSLISALTIYGPGINAVAGILDAVPRSWNFSESYYFLANTIYQVSMTAVGHTDGGSFFAIVDPVFTVDPNFTDQYKLEFSEGVGNLNPVPTPIAGAGLPCLLLASAGIIAWRRKRINGF